MNDQAPELRDDHSIPQALEILQRLIGAMPEIAIVGTLTAFRPRKRWASGELAAQDPTGKVLAQLRLSFPPSSTPQRPTLKEGNSVRVVGQFVVDQRYGPVQFRVRHAAVVQQLAAHKRSVEQLRRSIKAEGLHQHQQRLPLNPEARTVAVICPLNQGSGGADFITRLQTSPFDWHIDVTEVPMGASDAGSRMATAVRQASRRTGTEVIVICRGGGSPAEMAPFDDEHLARAIVEAALPVIVAVGHSHDHHTADLVAHHSAPTPSAAAAWLCQRRDSQRRDHQEQQSRHRLQQSQRRLQQATQAELEARQLVDHASARHARSSRILTLAVVLILIALAVVVAVIVI